MPPRAPRIVAARSPSSSRNSEAYTAPPAGALRHRWSEGEKVEALKNWAAQEGRPPVAFEWITAAAGRPSATTVLNHLGSWEAALTLAGLC